MPVNGESFLFWSVQYTKKGKVLRETGKISYSCLRELFNKSTNSWDSQLGFPVESFGLHRLGATAAANAQVPDRLLRNMIDGILKMPSQPRMVM